MLGPGGGGGTGGRGGAGGSDGGAGGAWQVNNGSLHGAFRGRGTHGQRGGGSSDGDGLNPNRQRGFGQRRIETPTLNEMRARQGAVVGKFMNFMHRKNTLVIEIYERAFYNKKPNWDEVQR